MKYLIRILIVMLVTVPFIASALEIIPCDGVTKACDFSMLLKLGNNIIKFCIVTGTSIFSIMFMYAGFKYLTAMGNEGQITKAHAYFWNSIVGFVIMLAAWLSVDFIFKALVKGANASDYILIK